MLNRSVEINTRERGADHPETATSLMNLGTVEVALGNFARGEELELRALEIRRKSAGVPSVAVAFSFDNLGWLYQRQKRYEKAERYYRDALAAFEATLGPDHPTTATCRKHLVETLLKREGRCGERARARGEDRSRALTGTFRPSPYTRANLDAWTKCALRWPS